MKCDKCNLSFLADEKKVVRGEKTFHEWCDHQWRREMYRKLEELLAKSEGRTLPTRPPVDHNAYTDPFLKKWDGDDAA